MHYVCRTSFTALYLPRFIDIRILLLIMFLHQNVSFFNSSCLQFLSMGIVLLLLVKESHAYYFCTGLKNVLKEESSKVQNTNTEVASELVIENDRSEEESSDEFIR